jgi:hypothetical protein
VRVLYAGPSRSSSAGGGWQGRSADPLGQDAAAWRAAAAAAAPEPAWGDGAESAPAGGAWRQRWLGVGEVVGVREMVGVRYPPPPAAAATAAAQERRTGAMAAAAAAHAAEARAAAAAARGWPAGSSLSPS